MDLLGKLKCHCYSHSTENQHHYSLISLRDFTMSLQFPQNVDITLVSVTGTCQSPFTQLRMGKLICKLNESPETCQEYLPQGQAAGDAQQRSLLCACFPLCPLCQPFSTVCNGGHLMKNGSYLFQSALALHLSPHEIIGMMSCFAPQSHC